MKIAFTICSNNYLAAAKTLAHSFLQYHHDYVFFIGLADKYPLSLPTDYVGQATIFEVENLGIPNLECLVAKYNITEFNTAVKPYYFFYFFEKLDAEKVIYLDPDILILSRLYEADEMLADYNIILTPHITTPVDDGYSPNDYETLRGGVFNLGFLALSNFKRVKDFLTWWRDRVVKYGFADFSKSMFYDQLWMNLVPCLYDNYLILKHLGYNMANWNLHERQLSKANDIGYIVNNKFPLRFFHFSGYNFYSPHIISKHTTRYDFKQRFDIVDLFKNYQQLLISNNADAINRLPVFYYPALHRQNKKKHTRLYGLGWRLKRSAEILITGQ